MTEQGGPERLRPANDPGPRIHPDDPAARAIGRRGFLKGAGAGTVIGLLAGTPAGIWISKQQQDWQEEQKRLRESQMKNQERLKSDQEFREKMAASYEAGEKLQKKFTQESQMNAEERMSIVNALAEKLGDANVKDGAYGSLTLIKKLRAAELSFVDEGVRITMRLAYPDPASAFSLLEAKIEATVVEGNAKNGIPFKDVYSHLGVLDTRNTGAVDSISASAFALPRRPDGLNAFFFGAYQELLARRHDKESARESFSFAHEARTPDQKRAWRSAMNTAAISLDVSPRNIDSAYSNFLLLIQKKMREEMGQ